MAKSKKVFILHGMSGSVDSSFGIKLKEDLIKNDYKIIQPSFTTGKDITLLSWRNTLDKYKNLIGEEDIFVCHSLACLYIIKYCVSNKISNKLIISVAGGLCKECEVFEGFEHLIPFIPSNLEIDEFNKLNNIVYNIYSNNDHIFNLSQLERYTEATCATPVFLQNKGHFGASSGVVDVPEIIEIILKHNKHNNKC